MSIFNGIVKLAVIGLTNNHNSENNNTRSYSLFNFMFVLFLFSAIGTAIVYNNIDDKENKENFVIHKILNTLVDCKIIEIKAPDFYDADEAKEYVKWKLEDFHYTDHADSFNEYSTEKKSNLHEYLEENKSIWVKLTICPLSALIFYGFSLFSFIILLFPLCICKTKISNTLSDGERNALLFLKQSARIIKNRLFFADFTGGEPSQYIDSYIKGSNIDALQYVFDKHKSGLILKIIEDDKIIIKQSSEEILKKPRFEKSGKIMLKITLWLTLLLFIINLSFIYGIPWTVSFFWLPLVVTFIYKYRKSKIYKNQDQDNRIDNLEELFGFFGIKLIEESISKENIEDSVLTKELILQIKKELIETPNKSYFRLK